MRDFIIVVETSARVKAGHLHDLFERAKSISARLDVVCTGVAGELNQLERGEDASDFIDHFADELLEIERSPHLNLKILRRGVTPQAAGPCKQPLYGSHPGTSGNEGLADRLHCGCDRIHGTLSGGR